MTHMNIAGHVSVASLLLFMFSSPSGFKAFVFEAFASIPVEVSNKTRSSGWLHFWWNSKLLENFSTTSVRYSSNLKPVFVIYHHLLSSSKPCPNYFRVRFMNSVSLFWSTLVALLQIYHIITIMLYSNDDHLMCFFFQNYWAF